MEQKESDPFWKSYCYQVTFIFQNLLSLPSPNRFKELNNTFAKLLWCSKPPKWRKDILEGKIHHGGLKLHNLPLFDKALKLSWLKRYIISNSTSTVFPNNFELWDVFNTLRNFLLKLSRPPPINFGKML